MLSARNAIIFKTARRHRALYPAASWVNEPERTPSSSSRPALLNISHAVLVAGDEITFQANEGHFAWYCMVLRITLVPEPRHIYQGQQRSLQTVDLVCSHNTSDDSGDQEEFRNQDLGMLVSWDSLVAAFVTIVLALAVLELYCL